MAVVLERNASIVHLERATVVVDATSRHRMSSWYEGTLSTVGIMTMVKTKPPLTSTHTNNTPTTRVTRFGRSQVRGLVEATEAAPRARPCATLAPCSMSSEAAAAAAKAERLHAEVKRLLEIQKLREEVKKERTPIAPTHSRAASRSWQTEASQQAELQRLRRELEQSRKPAQSSQAASPFGDWERRAASFAIRTFARFLPMERAVPAASFAIRTSCPV
jgi:hypothetical protein